MNNESFSDYLKQEFKDKYDCKDQAWDLYNFICSALLIRWIHSTFFGLHTDENRVETNGENYKITELSPVDKLYDSYAKTIILIENKETLSVVIFCLAMHFKHSVHLLKRFLLLVEQGTQREWGFLKSLLPYNWRHFFTLGKWNIDTRAQIAILILLFF